MTRFFFDLKRNGDCATQDEEGSLLPGVDAAHVEAARCLADFAREVIECDEHESRLAVIVRDDSGPMLEASLTFQVTRVH